jgi:hypothetical protein
MCATLRRLTCLCFDNLRKVFLADDMKLAGGRHRNMERGEGAERCEFLPVTNGKFY